jgi:hypothetical protein
LEYNENFICRIQKTNYSFRDLHNVIKSEKLTKTNIPHFILADIKILYTKTKADLIATYFENKNYSLNDRPNPLNNNPAEFFLQFL